MESRRASINICKCNEEISTILDKLEECYPVILT